MLRFRPFEITNAVEILPDTVRVVSSRSILCQYDPINLCVTGPDDAPASLKAVIRSDRQVSLSWFDPPTPNGVILEYVVIARVRSFKF